VTYAIMCMCVTHVTRAVCHSRWWQTVVTRDVCHTHTHHRIHQHAHPIFINTNSIHAGHIDIYIGNIDMFLYVYIYIYMYIGIDIYVGNIDIYVGNIDI